MSPSPQVAAPSGAAQALSMVRAGLAFLATADAPALGVATQAEVLAGLEQAGSRLTAARARVLAAFCAGHGYEADGQYGPTPWLRALTRVTQGAAAGAVGWMRRLDTHPRVAAALATGAISTSWARDLCAWTSQLPASLTGDADQILLAAAAGGADLRDLALLATEMIERARTTPSPGDDGFADRALWLDTTLAGAGRLSADLTPACAAALTAVLDALSTHAGPEDTRSLSQRRHDGLEEACQRLIAAGLVPGRDGQPLHVFAHTDLPTLAGTSAPAGASPLERCWSLARPAGGPGRWSLARTIAGPGTWCLTGPEAAAAACDATVHPVITGHIDWAAVDQLIDLTCPPWPSTHGPLGHLPPPPQHPGRAGPARHQGPATVITPALRQRLRDLAVQHAVSLLSGPTGLAAQLRAQTLTPPVTGPSLPLDLGAPTQIIPPHLRRAVALRDQHCRFPGCQQRPSVCQIHHLIPRARGGPTTLPNLALLCRFHHLIVIHRWAWTLTLHPNGTTTATSPDGRTLHSHSPPHQTA